MSTDETRKQFQDRGRGHRARLREKFLQGGLERFSDEEIIEFLLSLGTPRRDVKLQAREALKRFGSLSGVLSASLEDLTKIPGVGRKNGLYLHLVHQVASRYLKDRAMERPFFDSSSAVFDFLFHTMRDLEREVFKVLLLNRKNQLLSEKDLFFGSISGSAVYPREVISLALKKGAAALVFAHNHPSGDPSPSEQDRSLTRELVWAAQLMGIQVLDHVIIGHNTYYSFADQGLIRSFA
ncbi:MAG: RadC family protein, partial [Desulfobacteraceae bacterium]